MTVEKHVAGVYKPLSQSVVILTHKMKQERSKGRRMNEVSK